MRKPLVASVLINILLFVGGYGLIEAGMGSEYQSIEIVLAPLDIPEPEPLAESPSDLEQPAADPKQVDPPPVENLQQEVAEAPVPASPSIPASPQLQPEPNYLGDLGDLLPGSSASNSSPSAANRQNSQLEFSPSSAANVPQTSAPPEIESPGNFPALQENSSPADSSSAVFGPNSARLEAEQARLRESLENQFNATSAQEARANSSPGVRSELVSGQAGGRGLISADKLDLESRLPRQADSSWPAEIIVIIQVNAAGFVNVLNSAEFSAYTELSSAILRLLQGQIFVASPGAAVQNGSITFRIR